MNVIEPKDFDVFHYATMAKTIDYKWWTYGPINCVGPNFLATAMGCAGWEFHHLKPLFDSAKIPNSQSRPRAIEARQPQMEAGHRRRWSSGIYGSAAV